MKKLIFIFMISLLLFGCASKKQLTTYNLRTSKDNFTYEKLKISVKSISNNCVLNRNCTSNDDVSIVVYAGYEDYQIEYEVKTNKYTKLGDTGYYLKLNIIDNDVVMTLYK